MSKGILLSLAVSVVAVGALSKRDEWNFFPSEENNGRDFMLNGDTLRAASYRELIKYCEIIRSGNASTCSYMNTPAFKYFLDHVANEMPPGKAFTSEMGWKLRCYSGIHVKDPPVCWAAAYMLLPFPLQPELGDVDCTPQTDLRLPPIDPSWASQYKFKALVVETRSLAEQTCALLRTSASLGIDFEVIGQGYTGKMTRATKIKFVSETLSKIPEQERNKTIVLNVDSSDVFLQLNKDRIVNKFLRQKTRFLISAEMDCFPFRFFPMNMGLGNGTIVYTGDIEYRYSDIHMCDRLFPKILGGSQARWLNSGGWIGFADTILNAYSTLSSVPQWFINKWPGSDQGFFTTLYLTRRFGIKLDHCGDLFATFKAVDRFRERAFSGQSVWTQYSLGPRRRMYNKVYLREAEEDSPFQYVWATKASNRTPAVLHFNGGSFSKMHDNLLGDDRLSKDTSLFLRRCTPMRRVEVTMNMTTQHVEPSNPAVRLGCVAQLRDYNKHCGFNSSIVSLMLQYRMSGAGFFAAMSPIRSITNLDFSDHVRLSVSLGVVGKSPQWTFVPPVLDPLLSQLRWDVRSTLASIMAIAVMPMLCLTMRVYKKQRNKGSIDVESCKGVSAKDL
mmetsp:Transcript_23177/g.32404  ORF Transcript_23177/g.32404 Transcript_23177/m.32404 type:complete len:615 (+) Transcript_23177:89-1933(+)